MTDKEAIAYAAGLFDGEGCVSTAFNGGTPRHMPKLTVSIQMTDAGVVLWMSAMFGGRVSQRRKLAAKYRTQFCWQLHSRQAGAFLEKVLPYLQVKRQQAERAIALRALSQKQGGRKEFGVRGSCPVPADILAKGHRLRLEISRLNKTGST